MSSKIIGYVVDRFLKDAETRAKEHPEGLSGFLKEAILRISWKIDNNKTKKELIKSLIWRLEKGERLEKIKIIAAGIVDNFAFNKYPITDRNYIACKCIDALIRFRGENPTHIFYVGKGIFS